MDWWKLYWISTHLLFNIKILEWLYLIQYLLACEYRAVCGRDTCDSVIQSQTFYADDVDLS